MNISDNLLIIDMTTVFLLILALSSHFIKIENLTKFYSPLILISVTFVARIMQPVESVIIVDRISLWGLVLGDVDALEELVNLQHLYISSVTVDDVDDAEDIVDMLEDDYNVQVEKAEFE